MVANEITHVLDATAVRDVSDSDRIEQLVDSTNHGLVTTLNFSHDDYMNDNVISISNYEVAASLSQSNISGVAESYLSCDELKVAEPRS